MLCYPAVNTGTGLVRITVTRRFQRRLNWVIPVERGLCPLAPGRSPPEYLGKDEAQSAASQSSSCQKYPGGVAKGGGGRAPYGVQAQDLVQGAPADVTAKEPLWPVDLITHGIGTVAGLGQAVAAGRDIEDPTTGRGDLALDGTGSGMEHHVGAILRQGVQPLDD